MKGLPIRNKLTTGLNFISVFFASCFFLSYLPAKGIGLIGKTFKGQTLSQRKWTGAGLVGSICGALTFLAVPPSLAQSLPVICVGIGFSIVVSHLAEKALQSHDDSRIVIDEWIGVWVALWGFEQVINGPFILAFVLFRFFDVWKGPWGHFLQKLPGGVGVTMDDVGAGVLANISARSIWWLVT